MKALLLALVAVTANASEKCIEVYTDEEAAEISFYVDGVLVNRRIMLIEAYKERYKDAVQWQCNWSCDTNYTALCQSSSGGQSTTISFSQK